MSPTSRPFFSLLSSILVSFILAASAARGQTCLEPVRVPVKPETASTVIAGAGLFELAGAPPGSELVGADGALHGSVVKGFGDKIVYTPGDDFWSLRSDSFTYRFTTAKDPTVHTAIVQVVASLAAEGSLFDDFEGPFNRCEWTVNDPYDHLSFHEEPPGSGRQWLHVRDGADSSAYFGMVATQDPNGEPGWPGPCADNPIVHGTTDDCFTMRLSGTAPGNAPFQGEVAILRARFTNELDGPEPPLEIRLVAQDGPPKVYASAGDDCETPAVVVGLHNATLQLDLWRDHGDGAGMVLRVDDHNAGLVRCDPWRIDGMFEVNVGLVDMTSAPGPRLLLDDLGVGNRDPDWPPPSERMIDTFECGDLDDWSTGGSWFPQVTAAAALSGSSGLEIDLGAIAASSPADGFVYDATPAARRAFNLRFLIDPHTASLGDGKAFVLAGAASSDDPEAGEHLRLKIRGSNGDLELRAEAVDDSGTVLATDWTPLGGGGAQIEPHFVEIQWRAAGRPSIDDGLARLWVDGEERGAILGIDNDGRLVESFRLGAVAVPDSVAGVLYVDNVETWD
ncbi:MAG TPA: hypothetical protein VGG06_16280 [Thermoanaerobaculia bacterium]